MEQYLALLCCLALASGFVVKKNDDEVQWKAWKHFMANRIKRRRKKMQESQSGETTLRYERNPH